MRRLTRAARRYVLAHHRSRGCGAVAHYARAFLSWYDNSTNFDFAENGELWLAQAIDRAHPGGWTCFDVGANRGAYAAGVARLPHGPTVHSFEIDPDTFRHLEREMASYPNVRCHGFGLSSSAGDVQIQALPDDTGTGIATLHREKATAKAAVVRTLDDVVEEGAVARIDLLKIDTEGHELAVLQGASRSLGAGRVAAIQFEYGITAYPNRTYLRDLYDLLVPLGFAIGRLYPDGVWFRPYDPVRDESLVMGNYVAVARAREELVAALRIEKW